MRGFIGSVGVAIPSIPPRQRMLSQALRSVALQTHIPDRINVVVDVEGHGAAAARNAAWEPLDTEWVAFLDDDDEFLPYHLETLLEAASATGADLIYPWFEVIGGTDPLGAFGRRFDAQALQSANYIPVTVLVRRAMLVEVGGFKESVACEDWDCWLRLVAAGAEFYHVPVRTWLWHHHASNTSGLPSRWVRD